jgi:hypothetical protein
MIKTRATHRGEIQPGPKLYQPDPDSRFPGVAQWRINGFPARLLIWTTEEWERLVERPSDAVYHPSGVWCALRVD